MPDETSPPRTLAEVEAGLRMPLEEAMLTQRAIRRLLPDPVDDAIVVKCIELGLRAPTGSNGQNWEFVVVKDREIKDALAAQYRRVWKLYGGAGRITTRNNEPMQRVLAAVEWQVDHFAEVPVMVVACLRGARLPFAPMPPVAHSSYYGSIYPSVQNLLLGGSVLRSSSR
jgi:nitroreductase